MVKSSGFLLGKINEYDLVKNLQETACAEVRLHALRKIDCLSEKDMQSIFVYENTYQKSFIDICFISDKIG